MIEKKIYWPEGNAIYCCKCDGEALAMHDNGKWYCYGHFIERSAQGEWADLVDLVEEANEKAPSHNVVG